MFQNIVVPLDLTDRHQAALRNAAELVVPGGAISLVHVIETIAGLSRDEEKEFYTRLENNARVHLDRWGRDLDERRISWRAEVRYGDRALESVRYAQESGAEAALQPTQTQIIDAD